MLQDKYAYMKGLLAIIIVLIIGGGGYYVYQYKGRSVMDNDGQKRNTATDEGVTEEQIVASFQDQFVTRAVERIGFPIEGFDATLLMQAFPDLHEEDFEGVEALEGYYTISNGTLEFVRTQESPVSSAERTIANEGYRALLRNVSDRLKVDARGEASITALITTLAGEEAMSRVSVMNEYDGKVVYTVDAGANPEPLRADCSARNGIFNECGTTCEPGAEVCTSVCAFTCEYQN